MSKNDSKVFLVVFLLGVLVFSLLLTVLALTSDTAPTDSENIRYIRDVLELIGTGNFKAGMLDNAYEDSLEVSTWLCLGQELRLRIGLETLEQVASGNGSTNCPVG